MSFLLLWSRFIGLWLSCLFCVVCFVFVLVCFALFRFWDALIALFWLSCFAWCGWFLICVLLFGLCWLFDFDLFVCYDFNCSIVWFWFVCLRVCVFWAFVCLLVCLIACFLNCLSANLLVCLFFFVVCLCDWLFAGLYVLCCLVGFRCYVVVFILLTCCFRPRSRWTRIGSSPRFLFIIILFILFVYLFLFVFGIWMSVLYVCLFLSVCLLFFVVVWFVVMCVVFFADFCCLIEC